MQFGMKFGWPCLLLAVLAGVVTVCAALPDMEPPLSPPARIPPPLSMRPLRELRVSRLTEEVHRGDRDYYHRARPGGDGGDDKKNNTKNNNTKNNNTGGARGLLYRRRVDTDLLMDRLLHIRRHHAPPCTPCFPAKGRVDRNPSFGQNKKN